MKAFRRVDHLLCTVPDIQTWFEHLSGHLGFPVAWPIGRFWPGVRACGIGLGEINLELIQPDEAVPKSAWIGSIAFEPTEDIELVLQNMAMPYELFEKIESDPELLGLRQLPVDQGPQKLCTNISFDEKALEFPFFGCTYAPSLYQVLGPGALKTPAADSVKEIVVGHPQPLRLEIQLNRFGIEGGVPIRTVQHGRAEVLQVRMKNGPLDLGELSRNFEFTS